MKDKVRLGQLVHVAGLKSHTLHSGHLFKPASTLTQFKVLQETEFLTSQLRALATTLLIFLIFCLFWIKNFINMFSVSIWTILCN